MKIAALLLTIALVSCKEDKPKQPVDTNEQVIARSNSTTVGTGGVVSSANMQVLVGPAIVSENKGSITFFVQKSKPLVGKPIPILTCLLFNRNGQLIIGSGSNLPASRQGGTMSFVTPDTDFTNGKTACTITEGGEGNRLNTSAPMPQSGVSR